MKSLSIFAALFALCLCDISWAYPGGQGRAASDQAAIEASVTKVANMPPREELEQIAMELGGAKRFVDYCCPSCKEETDKTFRVAMFPINSTLGVDKTGELFEKGVQEAEFRIQNKGDIKKRCPKALKKFLLMCQKTGIECPNTKAAAE